MHQAHASGHTTNMLFGGLQQASDFLITKEEAEEFNSCLEPSKIQKTEDNVKNWAPTIIQSQWQWLLIF